MAEVDLDARGTERLVAQLLDMEQVADPALRRRAAIEITTLFANLRDADRKALSAARQQEPDVGPHGEGVDWQRAAFDTTLLLARKVGALDLPHLESMALRITPAFSKAKMGRWLGWAQRDVVAAGVATLDDMKAINRKASEAARAQSASPHPPIAEGMVRICEVRDAPCPHGMNCPFYLGSQCDMEASYAELARLRAANQPEPGAESKP